MTLRWYYSVDGSTTLEITDRVRLPVDPEGVAIAVGAKADAASGWEGDLLVDDPAGDLILLMFRRIWAVQDAAPVGNTLTGNWFISNLKVRRMDPWGPLSRQWIVTMADENSLLGRAVFDGTDANRPEETDIDRLRWFLTTAEGSFFDPDETYIDTVGPKTLDKDDLRQKTPDDMFAAMSAVSGKNYWVMYREDLNAYGIWYADMNTSVLYPSLLSISNDASEINSSTVYALSGDAELDRAGGRMASKLLAPYKTGFAVASDATFLATYGHVDRIAPAPAVSTPARALAQVTRQLKELQVPDDEITTTWTVEEANLNAIMHGMIVAIHATHFPNYTATALVPGYSSGYVNCRVVERTVRQLGDTGFEVPLRLSPMKTTCPEPTPAMTFPALLSGTSDATGNLMYISPGAGAPFVPTPFWAGGWGFADYNSGGSGIDYGGDCILSALRLVVVGDGTLTIPTVYGGHAGPLHAYVRYLSLAGPVTVATTEFTAGETLVFNIDTELMAHCTNWVELVDDIPLFDCGHKFMGYGGGATWVPD